MSLGGLPILVSICSAFSARAGDDFRRYVTLIATADPQVGTEAESGLSNAEYKARAASLVANTKKPNTLKWPSSVSLGGNLIATPLGVVLLGDLTQHASINKSDLWGGRYSAPEFQIFQPHPARSLRRRDPDVREIAARHVLTLRATHDRDDRWQAVDATRFALHLRVGGHHSEVESSSIACLHRQPGAMNEALEQGELSLGRQRRKLAFKLTQRC